MAVAAPVDVAVNPNNIAQRYILWGNGRIDAVGGAVPITGQDNWYTLIDQPIVVALWISDWTTGKGYMLDLNGGFHPLNGAPTTGWTPPATGYSHYTVSGVPYVGPQRMYVDWSWDPSGLVRGVVLDQYGQLYPFGGANTPPRSGPKWPMPFAGKLQMQWTSSQPTKSVMMDERGGLHGDYGTTSFGSIGQYWPDAANARDLVVTEWTTPSGYKLDLYGGVQSFGTNGPTFGWPYQPGADVGRCLAVLSASNPIRFWEVWAGGQQFEFVSSTAPSVVAGGGVTEVQQVGISGAPTGGTFTLTFNGQTTTGIAWNATATTVQTALRALSGIGSTGVNVTGGPGPGTAWVVTFAGALAATDVPVMTATSSLTGGTSPAVTVTTTTAGVTASPAGTVTTTTRPVLGWTYSDPQKDSQDGWALYVYTQAFATAHDMTDPSVWAASALVADTGVDRNARGITPTVDLPNGTYRLYVRALDTSGLWSAWSNWGWTQNVPVPATPTGLTAVANQATFSVALSVTATTGGSANLVRFEASDDGGTTWAPVFGADAVTLASTTTGTDRFPPLGTTRQYRAVAYSTNPRVASTPSATATATITSRVHTLHAVDNAALGGRIKVQDPLEWVRPFVAGVFQGLDADYPTVVKDGTGRPKASRGTLRLMSLDAGTWAVIDGLAESGSTLVYRGPFGDIRFCEAVGDWPQRQVRAAPLQSESTPLRHMHTTDLPLIEVQPPTGA